MRKALKSIIRKNQYEITQFVTDAHSSICCYIANDPIISAFIKCHKKDKWHTMKKMCKKARNVRFSVKVLSFDIQLMKALMFCEPKYKTAFSHFLSHCWKSIEISKGNGTMAIEYIKSTLDHHRGIHQFPPGKYQSIKNCYHENTEAVAKLDLSGNTKESEKDKKFYSVLEQIVNDKPFLDAVSESSPEHTTTEIELFHSLVEEIYVPKEIFL